jgi:hypothetical protein
MHARVHSMVLAAFGGVGAAVSLGAAVSCIVAPPPQQLPAPTPRAPRVLADSASPPNDQPLSFWPDGDPQKLLVTVLVDDANGTFDYRIYVDEQTMRLPIAPPGGPPQAQDGESMVEIWIPPQVPTIQLGLCHTIKVVFANSFNSNNVPASGTDTISWTYSPTGTLDGCTNLEGSAGADAPSDVLPIPPQPEGGEL